VAVHPRFAGTSGYDAAAAKHVRTHLRVPFLLIEDGRNPLAEILAHHLRAHDVRSPIEELITVEALNVLYGAYKDQDLRNVLEIARQAARIACDAGAQRVAEDHVSRAIAALARSS
jgi:hypothetical protein